jgi:hypothetical protein
MNEIALAPKLLAKKACNALIADASLDFQRWIVPVLAASIATGNLALAAAAISTAASTSIYKSMFSGLWVGGSSILTNSDFCFVPNALNVALHKELSIIRIPLESIESVKRKFGVLSGIIEIRTRLGVLKVRTMNATGFAGIIEDAIASQKKAIMLGNK